MLLVSWRLARDGTAYPFSRREFHLLPRGLRFATGKLAEHWIVSPLLLAVLAFLLWRDVSGALAAHAHTAAGELDRTRQARGAPPDPERPGEGWSGEPLRIGPVRSATGPAAPGNTPGTLISLETCPTTII